MKDSIPLVCCFIAATLTTSAQTTQFKNYPIANTGYSALFPADPGPPYVTLNNSELEEYTMEVSSNGKRYGMQLVLLGTNFMNSEKETLESLLVSYMQLLKLSYDVTSGIGYIREQKHPSNPDANGILDFWEDERHAQWAVKGWVDKNALVVLYVHTPNPDGMAVPYEFLDGFSFKKEAKDKVPLSFSGKKNVK
ncbi:MAG: hypothetical protein POELPBGB_03735 [Bacteroidia bacterium]|nr:hypothetical protein [Bacteroidia bacterium]